VKTLNVIGCGRVGKTLAALWTKHKLFLLRWVLNTTPESGRRAVEFVGAGQAAEDYGQLEPADLWMISTPDDAVAACCRRLCRAGVLGRGAIVFHCSGALASTVLEPARACHASIASVHPAKSFVEPAVAVETFAGTFCAVEGDGPACEVLRDALLRCGGVPFSVAPELKALYHAATVFVCNYLAALMEAGLRCFERAGIGRADAAKLAEPLVRETIDNVFRLGPARALTGPIEVSVVGQQTRSLAEWDPTILRAHEALGRIAVELAAAQGNADPDALAAIARLLGSGDTSGRR